MTTIAMESTSSGVSVSVSCFTLVAISLERYFAICRPLHSRSWQTLNHAYRSIAVCWLMAAVLMVPLAVFHQLKKVGPRTFMCVEIWQDKGWEKAYTMLINLMLLLLPVMLMTLAYSCVSYTLWIGIKLETRSEAECQRKTDGRGAGEGRGGRGGGGNDSSVSYNHHNNGVSLNADCRRQATTPTSPTTPNITNSSSSSSSHNDHSHSHGHQATSVSRPFRRFDAHRAMRQSNSEKSRAAKKRVIKMLFMIVIEFFVFWTPVYIIGTWITFDRRHAHQNISPVVKSLFHLLSYVSACCNPITYCFMNKNFRKGFLAAFRCCKKRHVYASRRSEFSFSGHTLSTRGTVMSHTMATTSYDKIRDSDDVSEKSF